MTEKKMPQTPEETAQSLSDLANKLEEMDRAEGFFGEAVTDEELEDVAGGFVLPPSRREYSDNDTSPESNR